MKLTLPFISWKRTSTGQNHGLFPQYLLFFLKTHSPFRFWGHLVSSRTQINDSNVLKIARQLLIWSWNWQMVTNKHKVAGHCQHQTVEIWIEQLLLTIQQDCSGMLQSKTCCHSVRPAGTCTTIQCWVSFCLCLFTWYFSSSLAIVPTWSPQYLLYPNNQNSQAPANIF